jgi:hypothetical protein
MCKTALSHSASREAYEFLCLAKFIDGRKFEDELESQSCSNEV